MRLSVYLLACLPACFFLLESGLYGQTLPSGTTILGSQQVLPGQPIPISPSKKIPLRDRMDLAMQQEVEMTKDPALGTVPRDRLLKAQAYAQSLKKLPSPDVINNITWTERGPNNVSGRTRSLLLDANDPSGNTLWAGGVGGGLWKTTNISAASPNWAPVNDLFDNLAVTTIAQDPSNAQVLYFGTGEGWYGGNSFDPGLNFIRGLGIWKSTDGGTSWTQLSGTFNPSFYAVQKLVVNAAGDVFAATLDGLQRSTDGGNTWIKVLGSGAGSSSNRGADIEIASNGDIYVAMGVQSKDGIYKSTDGGTSWNKLTNGLPTSGYNRIELACAPANSSRIYALFENSIDHNCLGIYRSSDGGTSWTVVANPSASGMANFARGQAWYNLIATVDPNNADRLFIGGIDLLVSSNAGNSWTQVSQWTGSGFPYVHADQHNIVFKNSSSSIAYFANDGGIYGTTNADNGTAIAFSFKGSNYNVTQFYAADLNPNSGSNEFLAGAQDNGTQRFVSPGINATTEVFSGDGAFCHIDQNQPNIQIASYVFNEYHITSNSWASGNTYNVGEIDGKFINPTDYDDANNMLYCCYRDGQFLRISNIGGTPSGAVFSIPVFGTAQVSAVKVSPTNSNRVFFGLEYGDLVRVDNANGGNPTATLIWDAPFYAYLSSIDVESGNDNHILISYSNYGVVSVWETTNGGATWASVEGNLPDMPARWVIFAPGNADQALVATELGVWTTDNLNGASTVWGPSNNGLANVRTDMLRSRSSDNTVVAATHGRGLFTTVIAPTLPVSPTALTFGEATGSQNLTVTSATSWTAATADGWISINPASAPGNGTVAIDVSSNTGAQRSGAITFTLGSQTQTVIVTQDAFTPTITLLPPTLAFSDAAGAQDVTVSSNSSWTAATADGWISLNPASGSGNGAISVSVTANLGAARSGGVVFTAGSLLRTLPVYQFSAQQPPTITAFSPAAGPAGTTVTITGANFNPIALNNIVFFGATMAAVSAATATTLTVAAPMGATYQPITVLNTATGLMGASDRPFQLTYSGGGIYPCSFSPKVDVATGLQPSSVFTSDFDGDGKSDMAVANFASNTISVFRNTSSTGSVSFAAKMDFATGAGTTWPNSVSIGDLDGDGKPDLAVTNSSSNTISVFRNTSTPGSVTFATKVDFAAGNQPLFVSIGDLDMDGKPDLVVANHSGNTVSVFRNTSISGTIDATSFAAKVDFATSGNANSVSIGDLDGDGQLDIAVTDRSFNFVSVFRNTSTPGFVSFASKVDLATGYWPNSVSIGDLDGDGKSDMMVANQSSSTVSVFRNTSTSGNISFASKVDFSTGAEPNSVSIGDLDGDGKADLTMVNFKSGNVSVLRNTSIGGAVSFAARLDYATGDGPRSMSIGDLDGDGKPDLAVANRNSSTVSVLRYVPLPTLTTTSPTSVTPFTATSGGNINSDGGDAVTARGVCWSTAPNPTVALSTKTFDATGTGTFTSSLTDLSPFTTYYVRAYATNSQCTAYGNELIFATEKLAITFSPISGPVGSTVTISGMGFNSVANGNIVFFGATMAAVSVATTTSLTATVPAGATYQPITVLNTATGLTGASAVPFGVTFTGGVINASSYRPKVDFITGTSPQSVAIGDLDGDGKADLAVANRSGNTVSVFRNTSTSGSITAGSFAAKVDLITGLQPGSVTIGDLDGDGKPDLVVTNFGNGANTVSIFRNTSTLGSISFAMKADFATSGNPISVSISDLDGDGKNDLAVTNYTYGRISVLRNTSNIGNISFAAKVDFLTGTLPQSLFIGDLDEDGKPEIVVANQYSNTVSVLRNTSASGSLTVGSFAAKVDFAPGAQPVSVSIGDLDGDGKPDLAVVNQGSNTISVFQNTAISGVINSGSFAAKVDVATGASPRSVAIGDADGDGKPDLAVANGTGNTVSILRNNSTAGALSFAAKVDYPTGAQPVSVAIGDLDGNGRPDLAVTNASGNSLSILRYDICATLSAAPANAGITNSACNGGCTVPGSITAPAGTPCPAGSILQYQVNGGAWSATLPTYNQSGPAQTIKTRCACEEDPLHVSAESAPLTTVPGACGPLPIPTIAVSESSGTAANDGTICAGTTATLTAGGGTSYSWSNSDVGAAIAVSPVATTIYTVTVADANGCTATASATITVNTLAITITGTTTICNGCSTTLTATGGTSYHWSNGGSSASTTETLTATTTYTVSVTDVNGCSAMSGATVTVDGGLPAAVRNPYMVKDIFNSCGNDISSSPGNLISVNGDLYFMANGGLSGLGLWKSDGTAAGTILLNNSISQAEEFTNLNEVLYFRANDGVNGIELWKSDGTAAGTMLVKDINSGLDGSGPGNFRNVNGVLYFTADDGVNGAELWKSDGTEAGTVLVKDIWSGSDGSGPFELTGVNGLLYFTADDGVNGVELWKSDGTEAGTVLVKDIFNGLESSGPYGFTDLNGVLYFAADDGVNGAELWKSDGTEAGTVLVKDTWSGSDSSDPDYLTSVNGLLYFSADDGVNGYELWKSDGTEAGTELVKDILSGSESSGPGDFISVNGLLYFIAFDDVNGWEFWKSDGTEAGTVLVKDIASGPDGSLPGNFTEANGVLYFTADDGVHGRELWKSDGTEVGTVLVKDILSGSGTSDLYSLTNINGVLFFSASDGANGNELWKSDGTEAGTILVKDIVSGSGSSTPVYYTNVNGVLYYRADDGVHGVELWKSDGTAAGTVLVKDIQSGSGSSYPQELTRVNGILYFVADNGISGARLWKSDGTAAGTVLVKDIGCSALTDVNGILYFWANDGVHGGELWKSDGTEAGTMLVKDIVIGSGTTELKNLTDVNGTLFFRADDGVYGDELWKSDGTVAGTALVKDIRSGPASAFVYFNTLCPSCFTDVNGVLYFAADDGGNGRELWKSDGTEAGTVQVKDIVSGSGSSYPENFTDVNGLLYFTAADAVNGRELWKSDGTAAGTVLVKDIVSGSGSPFDTHVFPCFAHANGVLYFAANDGVNGLELWKSDGTEAGTVLVKDIFNGPGDSQPSDLTDVNGVLYFRANDGIHGNELWKSDGTEAGTVPVRDIFIGSYSSYPDNLTNVNGSLFFSADFTESNFVYGRELWSLGSCTIANDVQPELCGDWVAGDFNIEQQTIPVAATCHCDVFNHLIATVEAAGANPVSGEVASTIWIENVALPAYVQRHYEITPADDPENVTGKITLYFTQPEFDAFNNQSPPPASLLPANSSDAAGIANIRIHKIGGISSNGSGLQETYPGASTTVDPDDADVVWNVALNRWEISIDVTGFSGFWLQSSCPALPAAPANVSMINSACGSGCTVSGGSITAPAGTPCPAGSSLQYQVNGGVWSTVLPAYNQTGPAQIIRTRCSCEEDPTKASAESPPLTTDPGECSPPSVQAGNDLMVCESNAPIPLYGVISGGATSAVWTTTGTGDFIPSASTLDAGYVPSAADLAAQAVTLTLTTDDPEGFCGAASDAITLTFDNNNPNIWYLDADNDNYYTGTGIAQCTSPGVGYRFAGLLGGGDCEDGNAAIHPGVTETCNGIDDNCDGSTDEGFDQDDDGIADCFDGCPLDPNKVSPGICGCGTADLDQDSDGTADCNDGCPFDPNKTTPGLCGCGVADVDADGDGYYACLDDCDDSDATLNPTTVWYLDTDNDNYYTGTGIIQCTSPGTGYRRTGLAGGGDCDDGNAAINPGATEVCNNLDDDCDGAIDEASGWNNDPATNNLLMGDSGGGAYAISDGMGGMIVVWEVGFSGDNTLDVYAQRIDATGNVLWGSNGVSVSLGANNQRLPKATSDGNGGAIVVWVDTRNVANQNDIYAQRISGDGVAQWATDGVPVCVMAGYQGQPDVCTDGNGGAFIVWEDQRPAIGTQVYSQRLDANGNSLWASNGLALTSGACGATFDRQGEIVPDGSGNFLVTFRRSACTSGYSGLTQAIVQKVSSAGSVLWSVLAYDPPVPVAPLELWNIYSIKMVPDATGGAIISFFAHLDNVYSSTIYGQRVNANGALQWGTVSQPVTVCSTPVYESSIAADGQGGVILAWSDTRNGGNGQIYAQKVNNAGAVQWQTNGILIAENKILGQCPIALVPNGAGGGLLLLTSNWVTGLGYGMLVQQIGSNGDLLWGADGLMVASPGSSLSWNHFGIVNDGNCEAVAGFRRAGMYAAKITCAGTLEGGAPLWYADSDGDGYGNPENTQYAVCQPAGYVAGAGDCDDTNAAINPLTVWYLDADNDNYYTGTSITQCASPGAGYRSTGLTAGGDCDDSNAAIHPGHAEICGDNLDNNCNGLTDEGCGLSFSGIIKWENDGTSGVQNATVNVTGAGTGNNLTDANGDYLVSVPYATGNFTIKPTKNINRLNGVTVADVTAIQQHITNVNPITSPYKMIAADINRSNSITTLDATLINQCLLGNPAANNIFNVFWRFVPQAAAPLPMPPWGFPEKIDRTGVSSNQSGLDFYGVKIGDVVNADANPANFGAGEPFVLSTKDQLLQSGQSFSVLFRADQLDDLAAFQFGLAFDPAQLRFEAIEPADGGLPLNADHFGTHQSAEGELRAVWSQARGVKVEEATPAFRLRFTALQSGATLRDVLQLDDAVLPGLSYNSVLAESTVALRFEVATGTNDPEAVAGLQLQLRPNPFRDATTASFFLAEACDVQLRVLDLNGRELLRLCKTYPAGNNSEVLHLEGIATSGALTCELLTPIGLATRKMVAVGKW